uniref:Uncharacterized protein n=1 Tax=Meloidogyne enterolobii TaxID=390850 RepID=A0A6V7UWI1_MELEN|nr:unnamed protein product [Meloidogyne enterolobii]
MVNAYEINFDYQSNEYNCQFIPDEQTIVDNYVYVLDNYQIHVDQKMREIFDEENAVEILEDWIVERRSKKNKGKKVKSLYSIYGGQHTSHGESSTHQPLYYQNPQHLQKFTVYSSEDSGNNSNK